MTTAENIIRAARSMLGTPFHHQGRRPGVGLDCLGLVVCASAVAGIPLRDVTTYRRTPRPAQLLEEFAAQLDRVSDADLLSGDVVVFGMPRTDRPQHVGFATLYGHGGACRFGLLHTYADVGAVVEHGLDAAWRARLHSVWRLRGVAA